MTEALVVEDVVVKFRPFLDRKPTLAKSLGRMRHRASEVVAVDGVSFTVEKGEAFGVIGSNGAGKSTLLRVMAGTLPPDEGSVTMYGASSSLLSLGLGFNSELSGRRNVYLGGLAAGMTRAEIDEIYDEVVAFAELEDAIDRPIKTYSSGMYSRLGFSLAMYQRPEIVFLDEVLAVGDEAFQRKGAKALRELLDAAGTVVIVSHALARVRDLCDRVLWLDRGKVRMIGDADDVIQEYSEWVRGKDKTRPPVPLGKPWSAHKRMLVVLRMMGGEELADLEEETGVSRVELQRWRAIFQQAGKAALADLTGASQESTEATVDG